MPEIKFPPLPKVTFEISMSQAEQDHLTRVCAEKGMEPHVYLKQALRLMISTDDILARGGVISIHDPNNPMGPLQDPADK